ncbi:MAG: proton-conducting transporter membrane subunit [Motiliproteus sp.]
MSAALLLQWILPLPLLGTVAIVLCHRHPNWREAVTLATSALLFILVAWLSAELSWEQPPKLVLAEPLPGLTLALSPEPLGILFALVASFLWPVTSVYAIGYMRSHGESHQTRFYAAFAVSIAATLGIALAANMFTLFLFYELLTLATYPLVTHSGTAAAKRAGRLYLGLLMGTSIGFMLLAMVWTWQLTGTLDFTRGGIYPAQTESWILGTLLLLFVFGTGKAALMPFHRWLPAAMVAPTPVSALLHAVAVVKAGVFTVLKLVVYLFGLERISTLAAADWLAYLAAFTIISASLVALTQDNLKARLAYSTISQLGYILLGAMLGVAAGVTGGSLHIVMHAFAKITLFFCAGAILVVTHKTQVSQLNGLGRRMPLTMLAFAVGSLSIIGLPPMGGTWSKWLLIQATLDSGARMLTLVLLASSLLNIAYLLVVPVRGFFGRAEAAVDTEGADQTGTDTGAIKAGIYEAPWACLLAIGITATGCIVLFFQADAILQLTEGLLQ